MRGLIILLIGFILGYLLRTRVYNYRAPGVVDFIWNDIQEHGEADWTKMPFTLITILRTKWETVIKKGVEGYKLWLEYQIRSQVKKASGKNE